MVSAGGGGLVWLHLVACGVGALGATDADLARAREVTSRGAAVFAHDCASCHGRRGEGVADAPPIMGPTALPEYPRERPASGVAGIQDPQQMEIDQQTRRTGSGLRYPFHDMLDVYTFVSTHPGISRKGRAPGDDWAVTTFLLAAQGGPLPPEGVTADNAMSMAVPRR